jgi:hypothetical protein
MQARLSAVQQALIVVTIVAFVIAAVVHPAPDNAEYRRALAELTSLDARFDRHAVEAALLAQAKAQGARPLAALAQQVSALSPVAVRAVEQAPSIEPLAELQIATLADIEHFSQPGVTLPIPVADLSTVASSLAWRLARELANGPKGSSVVLRSAQLQAAAVAESAVALESEVFQLQTGRQTAAATAEGAGTKQTDLERLYEARVKWRVSKQLRSDTYKSLLDARKASRDAQRALRDADKRYEAAVVSATSAAKPDAAAAERGIMQVELTTPSGLKRYAVPVRLRVIQATLPPLQGVALTRTRAAGLWDDVKALSVQGAAQRVKERFNWHNRDIELAGVHLGGALLLQLMPCVLPLLLWFLLTRMREVSRDYNPFRTRVKSALPRIGFPTRLLDALAVVVLPLTAAVLAGASLLYVGAIPALPLLAAVASLFLGYYAYIKLGELQRLMEDVVRSHSVPPPGSDLPEAS